MVCPYCHHSRTQVTNSRPNTSSASIWRRRVCQHCKAVFTTYETIAASELPLVQSGHVTPVPFSMPRLLLSIHNSLVQVKNSADTAQSLAETVFTLLLRQSPEVLTPRVIAQTTYDCLCRYNAPSGLRYGVSHGIITPDSFRH